ncbi:MAG TPA: peptidoglycan-binding protein [Candidatus Paceibacterota bacterium]|nr:peptidoglycan-binding protein [Candidatus Paceibacterota bacterium]
MTKLISGFFALSLILGGLYVPTSAHACSCIARAYTPQERLDESQGVFIGKVTSVVNESSDEYSDKIATFEVSTYWKSVGEIRKTEKVRTSGSSASCGLNFEVGETYIVFASAYLSSMPQGTEPDPNAPRYVGMLCSATAPVSQSGSLIASLGAGTTVTGNGGTPTPTPTPPVNDPFLKNLSLGMSDADVLKLQKYLNANGYVISATGAGSVGNETSYFGARTKAALIKFQTSRAAELGIAIGTGFFGPLTRALLNK